MALPQEVRNGLARRFGSAYAEAADQTTSQFHGSHPFIDVAFAAAATTFRASFGEGDTPLAASGVRKGFRTDCATWTDENGQVSVNCDDVARDGAERTCDGLCSALCWFKFGSWWWMFEGACEDHCMSAALECGSGGSSGGGTQVATDEPSPTFP